MCCLLKSRDFFACFDVFVQKFVWNNKKFGTVSFGTPIFRENINMLRNTSFRVLDHIVVSPLCVQFVVYLKSTCFVCMLQQYNLTWHYKSCVFLACLSTCLSSWPREMVDTAVGMNPFSDFHIFTLAILACGGQLRLCL